MVSDRPAAASDGRAATGFSDAGAELAINEELMPKVEFDMTRD